MLIDLFGRMEHGLSPRHRAAPETEISIMNSGEIMEHIRTFKSIVDEAIKDEIKEADGHSSLSVYATYKCGVDGIIAAAHLLCPNIIQIKDYIFIQDFWGCDDEKKSLDCIARLEKRFDHNKKEIEMSVNSWSIGDFFYVGEAGPLMDNDRIVDQFTDVLVYFWRRRAKELFPDRNIVVELGYELAGELGLSITMYQED